MPNMFIYRLSYTVGWAILRVLYSWRAEGALDRLPSGPFILAANHIGIIDPWLVGCITSRPVHFMAKEELFRPRMLRWWLRQVGSFPVRRGEADREAIRTTLRILREGGIVGIFVEGTRNPHGRPLPIQHGAAMLAVKAGVPIVPVAIVRQGRLRLTRVGAPIEPVVPEGERAGEGVPPSPKALYAALSDRLGEAIAALKSQPVPAVGGPVATRSLSD